MIDEAAPAALKNIAARYLDSIIIAYQAEARALDVCEVRPHTHLCRDFTRSLPRFHALSRDLTRSHAHFLH